MQDEQKTQSNDPNDMGDAPKVSAFHNAMELRAKVQRENEMNERRQQAEAEEAAYQAREEYAKELAEDKVELIRLKQGVIEDSDKIFGKTEAEKKYTIFQKIGNWFYHAKWWLGIVSFCVLVAAFLIYDAVTREDPDLRMMLLTDNAEFYSESDKLHTWLETLCPDYNADEKAVIQSIYIPVSKEGLEMSGSYSAAYNTQLLVQFQSCTCMLVLVGPEAEPYLQPEDMFVDLESLYPDCSNVSGHKFLLDQTDFAEQVGLTSELHPGSYLALRIPQENINSQEECQEAYDQAKTLLDAMIETLHITPDDNG